MTHTKVDLSNHEGITKVLGIINLYTPHRGFRTRFDLTQYIEEILRDLHVYDILETKTMELNLIATGQEADFSENVLFGQCLLTISGFWNPCGFHEAQARFQKVLLQMEYTDKIELGGISAHLNWISVRDKDPLKERHIDINDKFFQIKE